jgi:hypothetical protein
MMDRLQPKPMSDIETEAMLMEFVASFEHLGKYYLPLGTYFELAVLVYPQDHVVAAQKWHRKYCQLYGKFDQETMQRSRQLFPAPLELGGFFPIANS